MLVAAVGEYIAAYLCPRSCCPHWLHPRLLLPYTPCCLQALYGLHLAAAGSPLREFGLTWLQPFARALLTQYELSLKSMPDQLAATRLCLRALLDILVPLSSHNMQQLGYDSDAWQDRAGWAASKLG